MTVQGTQPITPERWQRIKEVFEAVLETPREQRSSAVAELCRGDASLCAEVESLLVGLDKANTFMNRPAIADVAAEFGAHQQSFRAGDLVSGRFKIVRFIDQGGMGEVYEAHDLEINSRVALKTIRPEIASQPGMSARFKQEVQLTRLVTHPNVCRTFDVSRHQISATDATPARDVIYLTMELLEGETLAQRLRRGRMSSEEALPLIRQMADGLESAHSAGVIHRDFKPGNVILCKRIAAGTNLEEVRAVVTDFGLARNFSLTESLLLPITASGAVIGTLSYMAPEQLEGKEVTPATDIYSLGLVMYEMFTGVRPFSDKSHVGSLLERLKTPPASPRIHVPDLSPSLETTVLRCLAIKPEMRFARASKVYDGLMTDKRTFGARDRKSPLSRRWPGAAWCLGLMLLIAGIWFGYQFTHSHHHDRTLPTLLQFTIDRGIAEQPTVSADGRIVVFISDRAGDGIRNIWLQYTQGGPATQVTHESFNVSEPALSPDGKEIAFHSEADGGLYLVPASGGPKKLLTANGRDPRFSRDSRQIVYWSGDSFGGMDSRLVYPSARIYLVATAGGTPQRLAEQFADARWPTWAPDGEHVLFFGISYSSSSSGGESAYDLGDWWIVDSAKRNSEPVKTSGLSILRKHALDLVEKAPQWWDDSLIFSARSSQSTNLFRVHISPTTFQINGEPERLTFGTAYECNPSISSAGQLFFESANIAVNLWALPIPADRAGPVSTTALVPVTRDASIDTRPSVSLDGRRLAFARRWAAGKLVGVKDLLTGKETQLTQAEKSSRPVISRDGKAVAFSSYNRFGQISIEVVDLLEDGTAKEAREVCDDCGDPLDWSNDGSSLLYSVGTPAAIGFLDLKSGHKTVFLRHTAALGSANFCPRDECVVFVELLDGIHSGLWLAPIHDRLPAPEAQWIQLTDGRFVDDKPRWSPDGNRLYFYSNRDGFRCLWKLKIDPAGKRPTDEPEPVLHLHNANLSLIDLSRIAFDLGVSKDKIIFNAVSETANIWQTDLRSLIR
jgi:serine/threonine protein kinase